MFGCHKSKLFCSSVFWKIYSIWTWKRWMQGKEGISFKIILFTSITWIDALVLVWSWLSSCPCLRIGGRTEQAVRGQCLYGGSAIWWPAKALSFPWSGKGVHTAKHIKSFMSLALLSSGCTAWEELLSNFPFCLLHNTCNPTVQFLFVWFI